jgi:hypothetical protein
MTSDSHRLAILTTREIDELYGLPRFTDDERRLYFDLSATEREAVDSMTSAPLQVFPPRGGERTGAHRARASPGTGHRR